MKLLKIYNFLMTTLIIAVAVCMSITITNEKLGGYPDEFAARLTNELETKLMKRSY